MDGFAHLLAPSKLLQPGNNSPRVGAESVITMTVIRYRAMTRSPPPARGESAKGLFCNFYLFILKISTQNLLNPSWQLLEIHQENKGRPSTPRVTPSHPIPSHPRETQGAEDATHCSQCVTISKPSCSYNLSTGEETRCLSSTHLDCVCIICSSAAPDGQMPETSSGVVCRRKRRRVSWLCKTSQEAVKKGTFCPE